MAERNGSGETAAGAARVLAVDDEPHVREVLTTALEAWGYAVTTAADGEQAEKILAREEFDVVLLDIRMPGRGGLEVLRAMRLDGHEAEVIVLTANADLDTAIEALRLRAFDYLRKPFRLPELEHVIARAAEQRRLRHQNRQLRRAVAQLAPEPVIVGKSRAAERLRGLLDRVGRAQAHVLILGESGSGKELAARAIHRASGRRDLPFLAINCAALPNELLESELFGHEKGAFTGAAVRRQGLLELAHQGTLFLDEVAEMSPVMQAKLLRAIDQGEIRRLGGDRTLHVDVRVIAATNKDLRRAVAAGEFRQDLYYRLGVVMIEIPPLRERPADIPLLLEHFIGAQPPAYRFRLAPDAVAALVRYAWPGNVRELRNVVERLAVLMPGEEVTAAEVEAHLPGELRVPEADAAMQPLEAMERQHILAVLQRTGGNRARAAKILGVDPKTLYNKLRAYEAMGATSLGHIPDAG
jgi:DNA-binding NtrC family response regulator